MKSKMVEVRIRFAPAVARMIDEAIACGLYGRTRADFARRAVDEKLRQMVEQSVPLHGSSQDRVT